MTEDKKEGFLKKAASNASKAAGGAINNAKNQAKAKAYRICCESSKEKC